MHHAGVLLGRAHIAGVLEGNPGVAGFKQHGQHLAPQVCRLQGAAGADFTALGFFFANDIGLFKVKTKFVVQVRRGRRREQRPLAFFHHAAHEQIGNPVGGVHVVRAAAVVAGVFAQLQELLDVQVPGFQVGADRALALAALVHRHGRVVHHFEEWHHTLRLAVGALDVRAHGAHARPVVAQAAGKLGQQGVFLDRFVNAVQVVRHGSQIARRQLGPLRAAVKQRGRARHEVKARQHFIELDGARLAVNLAQRQAHGHAHEEGLRHFNMRFAHMQKVAVIEGLQAEVVKLQVALGLECRSQARQVELGQLIVEQLGRNAFFDEQRKGLGIGLCPVIQRGFFAQHLARNRVQQQARGGVGVVGVFFDQCAGGQDGGFVDLVHGHAVVQVAQRLSQDGCWQHVSAQALAGIGNQALQAAHVQRHALAVLDHMQLEGHRCGGGRLLGALLCALFAVQHIGAGNFVVAAAHQRQFHMVLHVFNLEGAAARARAHQRAHDSLRQAVNGFAHAGRRRALRAVHCQKSLHHGHGNFVGFKRHHSAVAPDDLVVGQRVGRRNGRTRWARASGCHAGV